MLSRKGAIAKTDAEEEIVPILQTTGERRRHFRSQAWENKGRIAPNHKVSLLDLTRGGALIEHSHLVRPETRLFLTLFVNGGEVSLKCRVVRSLVRRYEVWPSGEKAHFYRTGLEFLAVSENSQRLLDIFIDTLSAER